MLASAQPLAQPGVLADAASEIGLDAAADPAGAALAAAHGLSDAADANAATGSAAIDSANADAGADADAAAGAAAANANAAANATANANAAETATAKSARRDASAPDAAAGPAAPDAGPDPATADPDATTPEDLPRPAPNRRSQIARLAFLALTVAAGVYAVAHQWTRVRAGFADLGPLPLVGALVPALASVAAMMLAWRGLLGSLGSPLRLRPASRIFFTSQLGKYLPGSVWPVVAQMQLGRAYHIPRARSAAAAALAMLVSLSTALLLAAATLPLGGGGSGGYVWAFLAVPLLLAGLHPKVANPALRTIFRLTRRPAIEPLTGRTLAETAARSLVGWLLAGAHIWVLAVALGASPGRTLLLAVGGYAFAWSVGFIIVFAPAGAGVREIILVAALHPVLDPGKATVVALASRLVTIIADLVAAAVTARGEKRDLTTPSEAAEASETPSAPQDSASPPTP